MNMDNSASTAKKKQRLGDKCRRNRHRSKTGKAHNRAISQRAGVRIQSSAKAPCRMLARISTPAMGLPCRRSEEHTSELQSLMRISYAVFCLKKKKKNNLSW